MSHPITTFPNESFDIPSIVQALRDVRLTSLEHRHRRNKPPKLPSSKSLLGVVEGLSAAL
ncbi:MAG: serine acetyltransferase, partial [Methylotenera sp.]